MFRYPNYFVKTHHRPICHDCFAATSHCNSALFPSSWTNDRTGDLARWGKQAMECGIDLVMPLAMWASHHIEIVEITAGNRRHNVISLRNQDQVPIVDSDRFIKPLVIVYTLEGKPIGWLNVMV